MYRRYGLVLHWPLLAWLSCQSRTVLARQLGGWLAQVLEGEQVAILRLQRAVTYLARFLHFTSRNQLDLWPGTQRWAGLRSDLTSVVQGSGGSNTRTGAILCSGGAIINELLRTPLERSSQYLTSRHPGEAFSTVPHRPKLGHIGQTVNATGLAYATCGTPQQLVARQCRGRGFGIVYCLRTADKALDTNTEAFIFLQDLQVKKRADERTRTADLISLRVCGQWLLSVAQARKSRIDKGFSVPCVADYCRVLRAG